MDASPARSRHPDFMRQTFLWALLPTLILFLIAPSGSDAQVTTSITPTIGAGNLGTTVTQAGNLYSIEGGTRPGGVIGTNLFHSFGDFSIGQGDIGNFINDSGLPTSNILGRVTGGTPSNIDGTVQTTGFGNANLFLVNPSGIVFGPHGSVEVGGSVSFTTAQYLRLFDGINSGNFYANPASDGLANSVLAVAPVVDFGFLSPAAYGFLTASNPNATITVQGSALSVPSGQSISLVGGNVVIQGATLPGGTVQLAHLSAPNGTIQLASTASPGEFDMATLGSLPNLDGASFTSFGSLSLASGSSIDVSGANTVWVKGGQLVLSVNDATLSTSESPASSDTINTISLGQGSSIVTSNSGAVPGADVQITVGTLSLDGTGTTITTQTFGDGDGGNVTIQGLKEPGSASDLVTLNNGAVIKTETSSGVGRGGDVSITADKMQMDSLSEVRTDTFLGGGVGGNLNLNVGSLILNAGSAIRTTDFTFGIDVDFDGVLDVPSTGAGGHVTIQGIPGAGSSAGFLALSGGSQIVSESLDGNGGKLSIAATSMNLDGASSINSSTFGLGHGGDIVVSVHKASLLGSSTLTSQTASSPPPDKGVGGTITVQGGLEEPGSKVDSLTLTGFRSGIIVDSFGLALPGDIEVHARTVNLTDGAVIEGGNIFSEATGGKVAIDANSVSIASGSKISSQARFQDAGQVTITANELTLDNGSIVTTTKSDIGGRGGDVVLDVGTVSLTNGASINSQSEPLSTGRAGDITITAEQLATLTNGSSISANSSGTGNAGNITVRAGSTLVVNNSSVTTEASLASGGQIVITAPEMVQLIDSTISTSVAGSKTDTAGGDITIDPQFVILQNSEIRANAVAGTGGNISIIAGVFLADPNSVVDASSQLGISGTVNIQSPVQNVGGRLTPLSQQFSSAAALLAQQCAARAVDGKFSTFLVAAREGLPVEPGGFVASPSWTAELFGSGLSGLYPHTTIASVTGSFREYDARPIQLAKFGDACH